MTAGAVLLSYGQILAACDRLGNLIGSPAPRHTHARVKVTLKRGLQVLKAQGLGELPPPSSSHPLQGLWEREGGCPGEEDARDRCAGLGGSSGGQSCGWMEPGWGGLSSLEQQREGSRCALECLG